MVLAWSCWQQLDELLHPAAAGRKLPPSRTLQPPCGAEPGGVGAAEIPPGSCFLKAILCLQRWSLLVRMVHGDHTGAFGAPLEAG